MLIRKAASLAILLVVTGCGGNVVATAPPLDQEAFDTRATEVIDKWRRSPLARSWRTGFVPLAELAVPPASGFPTESLKLAFEEGWYRLDISLPAGPPGTGTVRFPDGSDLAVPLIDARAAVDAMRRSDPPCERATAASPPPAVLCGHLTITGADLVTTPLSTSRGTAVVPAWRFAVAELSQPVLRVAVAPSAVTTLPESTGAPNPAPAGLVGAEGVTGDTAGRTVTLRLGVGACDEDVRALVHETSEAVVLGGTARTPDGPCTNQLLIVTEPVELAQPVGVRVVLDARSGRPLVVTPS
ncbi:hypothetical protein [Plantactinospora sp. GCM10030261]|uniref:hypothetical protein n=1 Tax=Plantactinospora sp. GCM10030261 TaxID=3273420 RepID=UPI003609D81B